MSAHAAGILGIRGLLTHAISDEAKTFYEHHGVVAAPTQPLPLILSIKGMAWPGKQPMRLRNRSTRNE